MKLLVKDLPKSKTQPINVFNGDKIYSFDKDTTYVEITKISEKIADVVFAIDNKTLDLIKSFEEPEITFNAESKELLIKKGKMRYKAKTFEYQLPQFNLKELKECEVDIDKLKLARKFTAIVEARPILTSVCLKPNGTIYASDSYVAFRHDKGDCEEKGINIPKNFIDLLNGLNGVISLRFNDHCIVANDENHVYIGRLVVGDFPKLDRMLIPNGNFITFNFDELKENYTFANKVGKGDEKSSSIICQFKNNGFKSFGACEFESEINAEYEQDYLFNITIDKLQLLLDVANGNETISIQSASPVHPIYYAKDNDTFVLTPIRRTE